ncbi:ABC transporter ATP-binding protein [Myxacorys almedinensis]|uniref:ATP-binding cassette domain-containing protein n=1 Tax=Myxacorys almedinensis A TaxID=2690445 RepID=A0A8J8CPJ1_9CYAN|nr:ABC transporter ATP-binding protein [Myxacorys almedinensis]NDJ19547.1 ATP-binding cassette domain-containing protein [Myxacorys almedinensis A]
MQIPFKQYGSLLADYLKPQRGRVIGLAIALLSSIVLQIINPQILGYFIDTAVEGGSQQSLLGAAIAFTAIALLTQVFSVAATYLGETVAWSATNALRVDLAAHCLRLDLSFHKAHTPGELLERVDGDVNALSRFFSQLVIHVLGNGILLAGILTVLCFENRLAGLSLSAFAVVALSLLLGLRSLAISPWADYRQISAEFYGFIGEHVAGREDIRANGAVHYVLRRFYELLQRWLPVYQRARFASTVLWATSVGLFTIGNAIALAVSAYLWSQNAITLGTAYLIFHYTNLLAQPIERIREELEQLQQVEASIHRVREVLNVQSMLSNQGHCSLPMGALPVSFKQIWFSYETSKHQNPERAKFPAPQNWTLQDLSFYLPAGQVLGLLGRTGSGKSTIARLLLRLYDIQSGQIHLGGGAIAQVPLSELRQRVGLVTQDVQLFQATVRDNLTFFDPQIPDDTILQTLEDLGLAPWLRSLPNGLNTHLGSDSSGLSAGQAQLLALVRVFLKNPGLVILDEASSRLDPQTEALIEQAINKLLKDRTGIIIAHRLQTVHRADQILILEQGQVLEYGDRSTLANQPHSRFAQLLKTGIGVGEGG